MSQIIALSSTRTVSSLHYTLSWLLVILLGFSVQTCKKKAADPDALTAFQVFSFDYDRDVFTQLRVEVFVNQELASGSVLNDVAGFQVTAKILHEGVAYSALLALPSRNLDSSQQLTPEDIGQDLVVRIRVPEDVPYIFVKENPVMVYLEVSPVASSLQGPVALAEGANENLAGLALTQSNRRIEDNGKVYISLATTLISQLILASGYSVESADFKELAESLASLISGIQGQLESSLKSSGGFSYSELVKEMKVGIMVKAAQDAELTSQMTSIINRLRTPGSPIEDLAATLITQAKEINATRSTGDSIFKDGESILQDIQTVTSSSGGSGNSGGSGDTGESGGSTDNGGAPSVTLSRTSGLAVAETATTDNFTLVLGSRPEADVTISLSSSDVTAATVSPASITFTSSNWNTPQTVSVTGVNDALCDGSQNFNIVTSAASSTDSNYSGMTVADVSGSTADKTPGFVFTKVSGLAIDSYGAGDSFSVHLTCQPTSSVTINLTSTRDDFLEYGNPGTGGFPTLVFTSGDYNIDQTITVDFRNTTTETVTSPFTIITSAAVSADSQYSDLTVPDITGTCTFY
jgi:hypothetical protein